MSNLSHDFDHELNELNYCKFKQQLIILYLVIVSKVSSVEMVIIGSQSFIGKYFLAK